jgi:hypothetical protein
MKMKVRLLAGLWEKGPLGTGGKAAGRGTRSSRGRSRASRTGSTTSSKTPTRASTGSEQSVHKGAVRPHHLRRQWRLPDHHRELTEGGAGRVVTKGPPECVHLHRELTEGGAGRGATEDPPDCVHHLNRIRKGINILPEGERERGPPFTNLRKEWSSLSSVTDRTRPENSKDKEEVERKTETREESQEARLEEEEEEEKVSGSRKIAKQKKISKYLLGNSASNICTSRTSRDHVYLDGERLEMPSSSSSSLSSSSSISGVSKELSPPSGSRGLSPAVQTNGTLSASNVSCAAATIFEGRRQE